MHNYLGYTKGVDDIYYCNMVGYKFHGYMIIRARFQLGVLLLSWGFFLDPKGALLQWEILVHHAIFGLSTLIPVGFFGFFLFSLSAYVPMGFYGFFFLYPPTYSSASKMGKGEVKWGKRIREEGEGE